MEPEGDRCSGEAEPMKYMYKYYIIFIFILFILQEKMKFQSKVIQRLYMRKNFMVFLRKLNNLKEGDSV